MLSHNYRTFQELSLMRKKTIEKYLAHKYCIVYRTAPRKKFIQLLEWTKVCKNFVVYQKAADYEHLKFSGMFLYFKTEEDAMLFKLALPDDLQSETMNNETNFMESRCDNPI